MKSLLLKQLSSDLLWKQTMLQQLLEHAFTILHS